MVTRGRLDAFTAACSGHLIPTGAKFMHSSQIGRPHSEHETSVSRSASVNRYLPGAPARLSCGRRSPHSTPAGNSHAFFAGHRPPGIRLSRVWSAAGARTATTSGSTGAPGRTGTTPGNGAAGPRLFPHDESDKLQLRLRHAVAGFVDGPREAVVEADQVVEEIAGRFVEAVTRRRRTLRMSWQDGDEDERNAKGSHPDTEQLRLALRDYRELAERLLQG